MRPVELDLRGAGGRSEMKAIFSAIVAVFVLYVIDQEFAAGKYTDAVRSTLGQIAHSLGI
jgi:hypothetical protein